MSVKDTKTDKWTRSLEEAGLLDEVDDSWYLDDDEETGSGSIKIKSRQEDRDTDPPDLSRDSWQAMIDEEVSDDINENASASIVEVHGARISVPPEREEPIQKDLGVIVDELDGYLPGEDFGRQIGAELETDEFGDLCLDVKERYEDGDYRGALSILKILLSKHPDNNELLNYKELSEKGWAAYFVDEIGIDHTFQLSVSSVEIMQRKFDQQTGYILAQIDGFSTLENILDISGLSEFETIQILQYLLDEKVIS